MASGGADGVGVSSMATAEGREEGPRPQWRLWPTFSSSSCKFPRMHSQLDSQSFCFPWDEFTSERMGYKVWTPVDATQWIWVHHPKSSTGSNPTLPWTGSVVLLAEDSADFLSRNCAQTGDVLSTDSDRSPRQHTRPGPGGGLKAPLPQMAQIGRTIPASELRTSQSLSWISSAAQLLSLLRPAPLPPTWPHPESAPQEAV